jgi:hypothetical protein
MENQMPKVCPNCQTLNGGFAVRCRCGFDLSTIEAPGLLGDAQAGEAANADVAQEATQDEDNAVRCARCGSHRVVPRARLWTHAEGGGPLQAYVYADPNAVLFKGTTYATLSAKICADCGAVELQVAPHEADGLYEAYRKSMSGPSTPHKAP